MYPIFLHVFAHFHTSIMVPVKTLFTLPVALPRANPVGMSPWSSEVVSKTKQLPLPVEKREIAKLYHSPWVPVGYTGGVPGINPRGSKG